VTTYQWRCPECPPDHGLLAITTSPASYGSETYQVRSRIKGHLSQTHRVLRPRERTVLADRILREVLAA